MKRLFAIVLLIISISSIAFANGEASKKKSVVIFYKVPDSVLACQNDSDDIVKGKVEFEKTVKEAYKNRFNIEGVQESPLQSLSASEYLKMVKVYQKPLILVIKPTDYTTEYLEWRNYWGGTMGADVPKVTCYFAEYMISAKKEIIGYEHLDSWYRAYAQPTDFGVKVQRDPRRNTKRAIATILKNIVCKSDVENINKYVEAEKYQFEIDRYNGNFENFSTITVSGLTNINILRPNVL